MFVSGYGPDIHVFELDRTSGALTKRSRMHGGKSPSHLAFSHNHAYAYAINEADAADSKVLALSIARPHGALTLLNAAAIGGSGAPHLAVHPSGEWLAVAHYGSGHTSVLSIQDDGRVGAVTTVNEGPNDGCVNAPQAVFDRSGSYLFVPCLGSDYILQFEFDSGQLSDNDPATVAVQTRQAAFDRREPTRRTERARVSGSTR